MLNLDAPLAPLQGDTIQLRCSYSLSALASSGKPQTEEVGEIQQQRQEVAAAAAALTNSPPEMLYAVKWYKDEREFFRYLAQDYPNKQAFPINGLQIDVSVRRRQHLILN